MVQNYVEFSDVKGKTRDNEIVECSWFLECEEKKERMGEEREETT